MAVVESDRNGPMGVEGVVVVMGMWWVRIKIKDQDMNLRIFPTQSDLVVFNYSSQESNFNK